MTNKQAYAGLLERLRLHRTWRDSHGELNDAPNLAAEAISSLLKALEPFAAAYNDCLDETDQATCHIWERAAALQITVGDLRNAAAALNSDAPLSIGEGL